jgi:hypothetical protein
MKDVLGYPIHGMEMHKYGLPFRNAIGFIFPEDEDLVDLMFVAVERHPELHIVTNLDASEDYRIVNIYEPKNADTFQLYTGDPDPEIGFSQEFSLDDWTAEQRAEGKRRFQELGRELTTTQIVALNYAIHLRLQQPFPLRGKGPLRRRSWGPPSGWLLPQNLISNVCYLAKTTWS